MVDDNPFDLSKETFYPSKTWTKEEQKERLRGYLEIDPEYWPSIRVGSHIRYYTKDGEFKPGGFVEKNPFDTKVHGTAEEKRFIKLKNGFFNSDKKFVSWITCYEKIDKIFLKIDAGSMQLTSAIKSIAENINMNNEYIKGFMVDLDKRIKKLERLIDKAKQ